MQKFWNYTEWWLYNTVYVLNTSTLYTLKLLVLYYVNLVSKKNSAWDVVGITTAHQFCRLGNTGSEKLNDLTKSTEGVHRGVEIQSQIYAPDLWSFLILIAHFTSCITNTFLKYLTHIASIQTFFSEWRGIQKVSSN